MTKRGYWKPDKDFGAPNPIFAWPPDPKAVAIWFKDYLWPVNGSLMIVAILTWVFLTPQMSRMSEFRADWIVEVFARNQIMLIGLATVLHLRLWTQKAQGLRYKWSSDWMGKSRKFLWSDQVRDNVFWERCQRRHDLDGLRGGHVMGLCQRKSSPMLTRASSRSPSF